MHSCLSVSSEPAAFSPFLHTAPFGKCVYNSVICFMPFDHVASCCSSLLIPFPNQGQHGNNQLMLIMLAIGGRKKKKKHCKGFAFLSACLPGQWLNWTVLAAVCLSEGEPEHLKNESVRPPCKQTVWCEHNLKWIYAPSSNWLNIATLPWGSAPCPLKGSILNCRSIATSKKKQFLYLGALMCCCQLLQTSEGLSSTFGLLKQNRGVIDTSALHAPPLAKLSWFCECAPFVLILWDCIHASVNLSAAQLNVLWPAMRAAVVLLPTLSISSPSVKTLSTVSVCMCEWNALSSKSALFVLVSPFSLLSFSPTPLAALCYLRLQFVDLCSCSSSWMVTAF